MPNPKDRRERPMPSGELIVPSHGRGRIKNGNPKGSPPGPGRPKSAVRGSLLAIVDAHGVDFVRGVLDGTVEATVFEKATVFDKAAKYGLGALKGMTDEEVTDRLEATIRDADNELPKMICRMLDGDDPALQTPQDVAHAFVDLIERHWV